MDLIKWTVDAVFKLPSLPPKSLFAEEGVMFTRLIAFSEAGHEEKTEEPDFRLSPHSKLKNEAEVTQVTKFCFKSSIGQENCLLVVYLGASFRRHSPASLTTADSFCHLLSETWWWCV